MKKSYLLLLLLILDLIFSTIPGIAQPTKMYVANNNSNTISQANLDGTGGVSLGNLNGTLNSPYGIVLDLFDSKMYVTNSNNNTISQANLDGTGGVSLGNLNGTLDDPYGIALDVPLTSPEIDVQPPAGTSIVDGGADDVGIHAVGTVNIIYTIDNTAGTGQLDITSVTASNMVNCSGFSVVNTLPMNIAAAATTVMQVSFNVAGAGPFSFDMAIVNTDLDETPYDIQVSGIGLDPTSVELSSFYAEVGQDGI